MTDTTAKIRAKGLDGTGFSEDLAASLFTRVGRHVRAIVDLQVVDKHGPNLDGKRGIELVITQLEVAEDPTVDEHLGEISRAIYTNRNMQGHTGTTTAGQERTVADVVSSGSQHRPHAFMPVDASQDNPICERCGTVEATAIHSTQQSLEPDPEETGEQETEQGDSADEQPDVDELTDEPSEAEVDADEPGEYDNTHAYDAGPDDVCQCGLPFEDDIHAVTQTTDDTASEPTEPTERHLTSVTDPFAAPTT